MNWEKHYKFSRVVLSLKIKCKANSIFGNTIIRIDKNNGIPSWELEPSLEFGEYIRNFYNSLHQHISLIENLKK